MCWRGAAAGRLFRQLVDLFQFYQFFPIDDHTGDPITDADQVLVPSQELWVAFAMHYGANLFCSVLGATAICNEVLSPVVLRLMLPGGDPVRAADAVPAPAVQAPPLAEGAGAVQLRHPAEALRAQARSGGPSTGRAEEALHFAAQVPVIIAAISLNIMA